MDLKNERNVGKERTMMAWLLWVLGLSLVGDVEGEVKRLVIGGTHPWTGKVTAFDVTRFGSLQSREYKPYQNILQTLDRRDDEGVVWFPYRTPLDGRVDFDYVPGEDPVVWAQDPHPSYFDASDTTGVDNTSPERVYRWRYYMFGTGVPVRVERFVFYPLRKMGAVAIVPKGYWHGGGPYWDTYMRGYRVSASLSEEPTRGWPGEQALEVILKEEPANHENPVVVSFPLQPFRFFKLTNTVIAGYSLSEIELYGEGFAPEAWYTSEIMDLEEPANLGRVFWDFKKFRWRKEWRWEEPEEPGKYREFDLKRRAVEELWREVLVDPEPWEDPSAPVYISVEVRAGKDNSPMVYYEVDELLDERGKVVTKEEYLKLRKRRWEFTRTNPLFPGMRGLIEYDDENWTPWMPVPASGTRVEISGVRRYVQFRVKVYSEDPWAFGRLDSIWMEYSPPLADEVLGEICAGEVKDTAFVCARPEGGKVEVEAGRDTTFIYAIRGSFRAGRAGFDAVRIVTPTRPKFEGLWVGEPPSKVKPDSLLEGDGYLDVYLPYKIMDDRPVRLAFRTAVLTYGTRFLGSVWNRGRKDLLPQGISPGDAVDDIATDNLQVFVREASLKVLTDVEVEPEVMTPNGDGKNDGITLSYTLSLVVGGAEVEVGAYDVMGRRVRGLEKLTQGSTYKHEVRWDGTDDDGSPVLPGVYLLKIRVRTDKGEFTKVKPVAVVY